MNVNFETIEKAWFKPKKDTELKYWQKLYISASLERTKLREILNELENDLINYFKREYPDKKLENYNLKNCTYDYALVILDKIQELKKENK